MRPNASSNTVWQLIDEYTRDILVSLGTKPTTYRVHNVWEGTVLLIKVLSCLAGAYWTRCGTDPASVNTAPKLLLCDVPVRTSAIPSSHNQTIWLELEMREGLDRSPGWKVKEPPSNGTTATWCWTCLACLAWQHERYTEHIELFIMPTHACC